MKKFENNSGEDRAHSESSGNSSGARSGRSRKRGDQAFAARFSWGEVDDEVQPEVLIPAKKSKNRGRRSRGTEPHMPSTLSAVHSSDESFKDGGGKSNTNVHHRTNPEDNLSLPSYGRPIVDEEEDDFIRGLLETADEPEEQGSGSGRSLPRGNSRQKNSRRRKEKERNSPEKEDASPPSVVNKNDGKKGTASNPPSEKNVTEKPNGVSDPSSTGEETNTADLTDREIRRIKDRSIHRLRYAGWSKEKIQKLLSPKNKSVPRLLYELLEEMIDLLVPKKGAPIESEPGSDKPRPKTAGPVDESASRKNTHDQEAPTAKEARPGKKESSMKNERLREEDKSSRELPAAPRPEESLPSEEEKAPERAAELNLGQPGRPTKAAPKSGFSDFSLSAPMLSALHEAGYESPTPVQKGTLTRIMAGVDLIGQAQTGTGKTAAFLIPILEGVNSCSPGKDPVALIVVPTRELAVQVRDEAEKLSRGRDLKTVACYGGKPIVGQIKKLQGGVDIVVGTPGRILDLASRHALNFKELRWVVLDEADRMLDIGFRPDIEKILKLTPQTRQTLLFSATLPEPVVFLAKKYMYDPEQYDFSAKDISSETIEQFYISVDRERKFDALLALLHKEKPTQAIVFCRTKRAVDRIGHHLSREFDDVGAIHGDLSQDQRDSMMKRFRSGSVRILVATDVIGRGIDVSGISHIINYDIPQFCDDYVHRVGRTGRMGREGVAFSLVTAEEGTELTRVEKRINRLLKRFELPNFEACMKPLDLSSEEGAEPVLHKPVFGESRRNWRRAL